MTAKNKARGNRLERLIVNKAKALGLLATRAWGSDGRALGLSSEVDLLIEGKSYQVKKRKKFPQWMNVPDKVDYQIVQTDYGEPYIILPISTYFDMLKERKEDAHT